MNCKQLNQLLDADPKIIDELSGPDSAAMEGHAGNCADCRRSVSAARLAHGLIEARTQERVEPSIYFASRVAALARERANFTAASFTSMWQAARFVVSSLVLLIVALLTLNYVQGPSGAGGVDEQPQAGNQYSLERVIVDDGGQQALTNAQVLDSLFSSEDNYGAY